MSFQPDMIEGQSYREQLLSSNGIVYPFTICCAKLSILLLYLRIFKVNRALRLTVYLGITFMVLYYTAIIGVAIGSIVKCNGLAQLSSRFCKNYAKPVTAMNAAVNVLTDFHVLAVPILCIIKLQLSLKHRLGLLLVLGSGIM
jgi:sterol-4alpha-carboxylate 3-dehydrogenase (decarboxylating)